jgi:hypothetical protein
VQRQATFVTYVRFLLLLILPAAGISMILFHLAGNPPTGRVDWDLTAKNNGTLTNRSGKPIDPEIASASWWILYVCVRHAITFSCSSVMQVLVIDFLCLSTRVMVGAFGNFLTLLIVQSRGWPFALFVWALLNFGLLRGQSDFVRHWLYWQDLVGVFNEENPRYVSCGLSTFSLRFTHNPFIVFSYKVVTYRQTIGIGLR